MALLDGIGDLTGHIYADKFINNMKGATYAKAYSLLQDAFEGAKRGSGGVTSNDRKQLQKIVTAFGNQFDVDVSSVNAAAANGYVDLWSDVLNTISPKALTGSTTGNITKGVANTTGNKVTPATIDGKTGTVTSTSSSSSSSSTPTTGGGSGYYSGGGGGGTDTSKFDAYIDWLQKKNEELDKRIYELEHPKVMTADELAAFHDIDYNEQHILDEYNERTNKYYQDAIDEYYNLRNNLVGQASRNNQRTINDYLGEWANAAPTAARRGELAANALSSYMNSNYDLNAEDYALNQAQNGLRSEWNAELAANPNTARQQYNAMGTTLASLSANLNTSQVKQYIDQLDAYSQMYAANRAVSAAAAQGVASQYAGLANAAATNATSAANRYNSWEQLYNYYRNAYGVNPKQNSTALTNELLNSAGNNQNT